MREWEAPQFHPKPSPLRVCMVSSPQKWRHYWMRGCSKNLARGPPLFCAAFQWGGAWVGNWPGWALSGT